jgi:hypothetical protein
MYNVQYTPNTVCQMEKSSFEDAYPEHTKSCIIALVMLRWDIQS